MFTTILIATHLLVHTNSETKHIQCGESVTGDFLPQATTTDGKETVEEHVYQFNITDSYHVTFYLCSDEIKKIDFYIPFVLNPPHYYINETCKAWVFSDDLSGNYSLHVEPDNDFTSNYNMTVTCTSKTIRCGDTATTIIQRPTSHPYQLILDDSHDVNFDTCDSDADIYFHIHYNKSGELMTEEYCPVGDISHTDECGYCNNNGSWHENFTVVNMEPGTYFLQIYLWIRPLGHWVDGLYSFSVNCKTPSIQKINSGDTVRNNITKYTRMHHYNLTINSSSDVNFLLCRSNYGILWRIEIENGTTARRIYRPNNYVRVANGCADDSLIYGENLSIPNMTAGEYLIKVYARNMYGPIDDLEYHLSVNVYPIPAINAIPRHAESYAEAIILPAAFGIVQVAIASATLWFFIGALMGFRKDYPDEKIIIYSGIGTLLLAFIHGIIQSFVLSNVFVAGAEIILEFRCNGLYWHQIYIFQLGPLFINIYLSSTLKSLNVFQTAMYYCLLVLIICTTIFTAALLPWYNVPTIYSGDCNDTQLLMCGTADPSDDHIHNEYVAFLAVDAAAQCILLLVFLYQTYGLYTGYVTCVRGKNKFTYRMLVLAIIVVLSNLIAFIVYATTKQTLHVIQFIIYSMVILLSLEICVRHERTGDSIICWCCIEDNSYSKLTGKVIDEDIIEEEQYDQDDDNKGIQGRVHMHYNVAIKREQHMGLL